MAQLTGILQVVHPYNPDEISLDGWVAQFNEVCNVFGVEAEPEVAPNALPPNNPRRMLFLSAIGQRYYEVLRHASLPFDPNVFPVPTLVESLRERFEPAGLQSTNRFNFHSRVQQDGESAVVFMNALQGLAQKCGFDNNTLLDMLRDRVVQGVRSNDLRIRLMSTPNLDYFMARSMVIQYETIHRESRLLAQGATAHHVSNQGYKTSKKQQRQQHHPNRQSANPSGNSNPQSNPSNSSGNRFWKKCGRCKKRHDWRTCSAKQLVCHKCGVKGHIAKACRHNKVHNVQAHHPQAPSAPTEPVASTSHFCDSAVNADVDKLFANMNWQS